jgi:hypothetical protein
MCRRHRAGCVVLWARTSRSCPQLEEQREEFCRDAACLGQESAKVEALCDQLGQLLAWTSRRWMEEIEEQVGYGDEEGDL